MNADTIEPHRRPNESCLEPFREQIAERRRLQWPYRRLAKWLHTEHRLEISPTAVRKFCLVRNIWKGRGEVGVTTMAARRGETSEREKWNFNTDGPLILKRHQRH